MGITISSVTKNFAKKRNDHRIKIARKRHTEASKKAQAACRNANIILNKYYKVQEGILCDPRIAD